MSKLISPRAGARPLRDLGERSGFVARQRIGRARRRHSIRGSRLRRWSGAVLLAGIVAGGLGAALHWAATTPRFAVGPIEVRGVTRLAPAAIVAAAAVAPGTNVFRVNPREVTARIEALPGVRRADVVRALPNRLAIVVEERAPFALVHAGRLLWIDEDGHVVGEERRAVTPPVPIISGLEPDELAGGSGATSPRARTALAVIRTLLRSGSGLSDTIAEIDVGSGEGPVLRTMAGIEVRLGDEDWADRLARLEGVLARIASEAATVAVIDLRFRDQVVLREEGER